MKPRKKHATFIKNLRQARLARDITGTKIAQLLRETPQAYHSWESGVTEPSLIVLCKMADVLGTTTDALLGRAPATVSVQGNQNAANNSSVRVSNAPCANCAKKDAVISQQSETIANLSAALARK